MNFNPSPHLVIAAWVLTYTAAAQTTYNFTSYDIPAATSGLAGPGGINKSGKVVGSYWGAGNTIHGYSRTYAGVVAAAIDYPASGVTFTWPAALNDRGTIVGFYSTQASHGFVRTNGQFTSYDIAGATNTSVWGVNNNKHLAGSFDNGGGTSHCFLDTLKGSPMIFDYPGATSTVCFGMNNHDALTGIFGVGNVVHGFIRQPGGSLTQIDAPGAGTLGSSPGAINDSSMVAGFFFDGANKRHGFTFTRGVYATLDYPAALETIPAGINNSGWISGIYVDSSNTAHGFIAVPAAAAPDQEPDFGQP